MASSKDLETGWQVKAEATKRGRNRFQDKKRRRSQNGRG